jgi:SAM-dependent methyltransferase
MIMQNCKRFYKKHQFIVPKLMAFIYPYYIVRRSLYEKVCEFKNFVNGSVLDFGCGSKPYKSIFNYEQYIGIDIDSKGDKSILKDVDIYYDGKNIPFENEKFDSIFCSEVLEHVFNIDEILDEFYRVLKKDGKVVITVPFAWREHEVPFDFGRYTQYGLSCMFEKHDLKLLKISSTTSYCSTILQHLIHIVNTSTNIKGLKTINFFKQVIISSIFNSLFILSEQFTDRTFPCNYVAVFQK